MATMLVEPKVRRPQMERRDLASRLRVARAEKNWGLVEAAKKIGISATTLGDAESGKRMPLAETVMKIAEGYGVPFTRLFTDAPVTLEERGGQMHLDVPSEEYIDIAVTVALQAHEIFTQEVLSKEKSEEFRKILGAALRRSFEESAE